MSSKLNKDLVFNIASKLIEENGFKLLEVELKKSGDKLILGLVIDNNGGVSIEDCEQVSTIVDPVLDETEGIAGNYDFFTVSSAGLDRPFKSTEDFTLHLGEKVELKLYSAIEKKKFITALLKQADDEKISIVYKNKNIEIKRSNIQKANIAIEF